VDGRGREHEFRAHLINNRPFCDGYHGARTADAGTQPALVIILSAFVTSGGTTMHKTSMVATLCLTAATVATAVGAESAPSQRPCVDITVACQEAGFVRGGAREGNGLMVDCVAPIMRGTPQRSKASKPLPPIDPQLVAACQARNPNFGQPKAARSQAAPPAPASLLPPAAAPQAPPAPQTGIKRPNIVFILTSTTT
jgi:hypothetical protein